MLFFQDKRFRKAFFAIAFFQKPKPVERSRSYSTCSADSTSVNKNISTSIEITNSMKNRKLIRKTPVHNSKLKINFQRRRNNSVKVVINQHIAVTAV